MSILNKQKRHRIFAYEVYGMEKRCEKCGVHEIKKIHKDGRVVSNIDVHHKDEDHSNNERTNLQTLCRPCHTRIHATGSTHMIGKILSAETRKKISLMNKGKKLSEETKRKLSEAKMGVKPSDDHRRRMSEGRKGMRLSEEHKNNIKKSLLIRKLKTNV